jgi:hypothetical protein
MNMIPYDIVYYLKQQPIHGMPIEPIGDFDAELQEQKRRLNDIETTAKKAFTSITDNFKSMIKAFTNDNIEMQMGLNTLLGSYNAVIDASAILVKQATILEQRNKGLVSSFKISTTTAAELGKRYDELSQNLYTGGENVRVMAQRINKLLPGMSKMLTGASSKNAFGDKFQKNVFMTNNLLVDHMKLTEEQANTYMLMAAASGKSGLEMLSATSDFADKFEAATGLTGQFGNMLEGVASLSEDIQMTYRKIPGSLQLAVVKAKLLGLEFSKIDAAAEKLLDIETSVNDELNYQLISGKRLVNQNGESITQKMRIAKLSGEPNAMTEAMNELLESQGEILDGNNFYAKQQLAQLTGFTVSELQRANNMKKLMDQTGMGKEEFNRIMDLDPQQFADATKDYSEDQKTLFEKLRQEKTLKSSDEILADLAEGRKTLKVMMVTPDQTGSIAAARNQIVGSDLMGGRGSDAILKTAEFGFNQTIAKELGKAQAIGGSAGIVNTGITKFVEALPGFSTTIGKFSKSLTDFTKDLSGYNVEINVKPATPAIAEKDAVMVNDGVIQFHPADKFATVPDGAALLASTSTGQLGRAVDSMTGGGKVAVVDPGPIAAAIVTAMKSMKIEVNYNPREAAKAIEFGVRSINT